MLQIVPCPRRAEGLAMAALPCDHSHGWGFFARPSVRCRETRGHRLAEDLHPRGDGGRGRRRPLTVGDGDRVGVIPMERLRYLDFELEIGPQGEHHIARVLHSPAGEAAHEFALPFSAEKLENLVLKLGPARGRTRRIHSAEMEAALELGEALFESVFDGEVRDCLMRSLDETDRQEGMGLRVRLRLETPELEDVPWEYLFDPSCNRFLAQSNRSLIVRYVELPQKICPLRIDLPLRLLVMISSPSDYQRLDVEREKSCVESALSPLSKEGKVRVGFLERATLTGLYHRLRDAGTRGEAYHVFHFIGHGGFDQRAGEGVLVLEDEQGRGQMIGPNRLGLLFYEHCRTMRLAVLNSCEGARNSRTDPFAGVATNLIRQGIPAVIAMQFEISDQAAITFAGEFYTALTQGYPVDAAVAEARKAIYFMPNDIEWGTPVLYMRSPDGVLFSIEQTPPPPPQMRPSPEVTIGPGPPSTLEGHQKIVLSVAFSPDGTTLASGSFDETVRLWSIPDGKLLRTLEGHMSGVGSVAFSPDGDMLASGSFDKAVRLWSIPSGMLQSTLTGHTGAVVSTAFSHDGKALASSASYSTGLMCLGLSAAEVAVAALPLGPLGPLLAPLAPIWHAWTQSEKTRQSNIEIDKTVRLWSIPDGKLLRTLEGHTSGVSSVAFSPDGDMLASGSLDKAVRLWSIPDGKQLRIMEGHSGGVTGIAFSPDGVTLASGSGDKTVRLWGVLDGSPLRTLEGHT